MSVTDRAFIKAFQPARPSVGGPPVPDALDAAFDAMDRIYGLDTPGTVPPPPHFGAPCGTGDPFALHEARTRRSETALSETATPSRETGHGPPPHGARPLSDFVTRLDVPSADHGWARAGRASARWPAMTDVLTGRWGHRLRPIADHLVSDAADRLHVVGFSGTQRNEGRTTLLLTLARLLVDRRKTVAAVDADLTQPAVGSRLGFRQPRDWPHVLRGDAALEEALVVSCDESLIVLPCNSPVGPDEADALLQGIRPATHIAMLRQHADVVLVDLGPIRQPDADAGPVALARAAGIDTVLLVRDCREATTERVAMAAQELDRAGVRRIAVLENFAADHASSSALTAD